MALVVSGFGVLVIAAGLFVLITPGRLLALVQSFDPRGVFGVGVGVRVLMGVAFLYAAPSCRLPLLVRVVGILALAAALGLVLIGPRRFASFVDWWTARPSAFVRAWGLVALGFGALLVYAGA